MTSVRTPEREAQTLEALAKANHTRLSRSRIKREIVALSYQRGREEITKLIMEPGELWASCRLDYLLRTPRGCGRFFASKILNSGRYPVSPRKRLDSLTIRQRLELATAIRSFGRKM